MWVGLDGMRMEYYMRKNERAKELEEYFGPEKRERLQLLL